MLLGDPETLDRARVIALHGMSRDAWNRYESGGSWDYDVVLPGFKYNMSDIQAALGLAQLRRLPEMQRRRAAIWTRYADALGGCRFLEIPSIREHVTSSMHLFVVKLNLSALTIDRGRFILELAVRNIGSSVHFKPLHRHPFYMKKYGLVPAQFPVAEDAFQRMVSLPLSPAHSDDDVEDVIDAVLEVGRVFAR